MLFMILAMLLLLVPFFAVVILNNLTKQTAAKEN